MKSFLISRIFPLPFVLVGVCALYFGIRGLYRSIDSESWPTADGVIQRSSVEYHDSRDSGGTYHAEILYDYSVEGTTYSGNEVAFGDLGSGNPDHARSIVNKYPIEKQVRVYYLADDPETSILEPGMQLQTWFLPGFGLVFFIAGTVMLLVLPKIVGDDEEN